MSELVHIRASHDDCDIGQEGTTRWVYLDPTSDKILYGGCVAAVRAVSPTCVPK
jgi:hypothetical protein